DQPDHRKPGIQFLPTRTATPHRSSRNGDRLNKPRVTIGPILAGSLLLLTACATSTGNTQSAGNSTDPTTVENCGSTQTFDAIPERVVVQPHQSLELFAALGAADRVV